MENTEQPSKTDSLQLILSCIALIILASKYILEWQNIVFADYQGSLLTFIGFTLFAFINYLKYRKSEDAKQKKVALWMMIGFGTIAVVTLYELSKYFI